MKLFSLNCQTKILHIYHILIFEPIHQRKLNKSFKIENSIDLFFELIGAEKCANFECHMAVSSSQKLANCSPPWHEGKSDDFCYLYVDIFAEKVTFLVIFGFIKKQQKSLCFYFVLFFSQNSNKFSKKLSDFDKIDGSKYPILCDFQNIPIS